MQAVTDSATETPRCVSINQGRKGQIHSCVNCGMVQEVIYHTTTSKHVESETNQISCQSNQKRNEQRRRNP